MLRYLLDTNICIYVIKHRPAEVRERFNQHERHLAISSVTLAELLYGAEKSAQPAHNLQVVENFAARLEVLSFDPRAAAPGHDPPAAPAAGHSGSAAERGDHRGITAPSGLPRKGMAVFGMA